MAGSFLGRTLAGISWFSIRKGLNESKSIPVDRVPDLLSADAVFFNLQYSRIIEDVQAFEKAGRHVYAIDGLDCSEDLDGVFALIHALDVVVTCSNTVAHMAGAIGKRTILLAPDRFGLWYWGRGDSTPWYPSVQIVRMGGDWKETADRVRQLILDT